MGIKKFQLFLLGKKSISRPSPPILQQEKMYPNLLAWYLQCYLDPEVAIYLEQCLFIDELIELILKNWGNLKVKGEQLLIYDDLATFGTSS